MLPSCSHFAGDKTLKNHSPVNKDVSLEQGRQLQAPAHGEPILHMGVTKVFINLDSARNKNGPAPAEYSSGPKVLAK